MKQCRLSAKDGYDAEMYGLVNLQGDREIMSRHTVPQGRPEPVYTTLDEWIQHEAIPFSVDSAETFRRRHRQGHRLAGRDAGAARLRRSAPRRRGDPPPPQPALPAPGGGARLQRDRHREQLPRARVVNEYVAGRGPASYRGGAGERVQPRLRPARGEPGARGVDAAVQRRSVPRCPAPVLRLRQPDRDDRTPTARAGSWSSSSTTWPRLTMPAPGSIANASTRCWAGTPTGRTPPR